MGRVTLVVGIQKMLLLVLYFMIVVFKKHFKMLLLVLSFMIVVFKKRYY